MDDWQLLNDYATRNSEEAFHALVERYAGMVYHTALRQVENPHLAEEVAQVVFIILARKAAKIPRQPTLYGWLFRATRFAVLNQRRQEKNRSRREQEAYAMQSASSPDDLNPLWEQITPLLDDALDKLPATDRELVMIRYFGNRSHKETAQMLGVSEYVVRKRLSRAVEKLRVIFARRGVAVSSLALVAAFTAHGVQAAPLGLASSLAGVAVAKGATVSTSTLTLIKGAMKIMAWTKAKTAIVTGAAVILAVGMATSIIAVRHKHTVASKAELTESGNGAYGLYIHFGSATFANPGEKGAIPSSRFAPASLNVQSWAHAAKQAGMTFAVLTAKHESGFCLWDSQDYSYDVGNSPFKGDIIGDFIAACKAEGIAPGVHYSIPDEFNEGAVRYKGAVSRTYFDLIKKHVTELHTLYPDLRMQIFDMSERLSQEQFDELRGIVKQLNPQCIVWGTAPGQSPNHDSDTVISTWMWTPNASLNAAQSLSQHHQRSQAVQKAFVLNIGPDRVGEIPKDQLAVLMQVK